MGLPEYQVSAKFSPKYQLSVKIHDYQLTLEGIRGGGGVNWTLPPRFFWLYNSEYFV